MEQEYIQIVLTTCTHYPSCMVHLVGAGSLWPLRVACCFFSPHATALDICGDDQVSQGQTYEVFKRQTQEEIFS